MKPRSLYMLLVWQLVSLTSIGATDTLFPLTGTIVLPDGAPVKEFGLLPMWLHLSSGRQLTTFVKRDGTFVLHGVPAGTHLLSIDSPTYMFPQLRVDIDPQRNGLPTVMLADDNAVKLQEPLVIRPAALASFFEERKAFNVVGFLKSPMGIIGVLMVLGMLVMPKLKLDPEELRQLQEMRAERAERQRSD